MNRVGLGFDVHAFEAGRPLILGGVTIPDADGLAGHSDADVVTHAIADALLGAAGLGDLGERFPATAEWKEASSIALLRECNTAVGVAGWTVVNVDATVIAQAPKLSPYRRQMVMSLADALAVSSDVVSVKATTTDRLGAIGKGEGVAALAVVLIARP